MEAAKDVAKSVEGCVTTCKDVSRDEPSLRELGSSAQDVTRALNDLLNHVKDGHTDRIPDIMEQIMVASGELIGSYDSGEMVRQARILAQSTAELIQAIKGEAETQSDSDLQVGCFSSRVNHIVILLIFIWRCKFWIAKIGISIDLEQLQAFTTDDSSSLQWQYAQQPLYNPYNTIASSSRSPGLTRRFSFYENLDWEWKI